MNAITFMTRENWNRSVARNARLHIDVPAMATYRFNASAVWDTGSREAARARLGDFVARHGLPVPFAASVDDRSVDRIALNAEQRAAFDEVHAAMRGQRPELRAPGAEATPAERMGMPPFICVTAITCLSALLIIVQQNISDLESDFE